MNYKKLSLILPFSNSQRVSSSSDDEFDGDDLNNQDSRESVERNYEQNNHHGVNNNYKDISEAEPKRAREEYGLDNSFNESKKYFATNDQNKARLTVAELGTIANTYHEQQAASEAEYIGLIEDLHEGLLGFLANVQFANQQFCAVDKDNPAIKEHTNYMAKELLTAIREDFELKCMRRLENYPYHDMRDIVRFLDHPYMRKDKIRIFADGIVERCIPVFSLMRDLVNDVVTDADLRRAFGGGKYYHEDTMYSCNEQCFVSDVNCFFDTAVPYFDS